MFNSSPGVDGITNEIINKLLAEAGKRHVQIFNAALSLQHFPTSWKEAKVVVFLGALYPSFQIQEYAAALEGTPLQYFYLEQRTLAGDRREDSRGRLPRDHPKRAPQESCWSSDVRKDGIPVSLLWNGAVKRTHPQAEPLFPRKAGGEPQTPSSASSATSRSTLGTLLSPR